MQLKMAQTNGVSRAQNLLTTGIHKKTDRGHPSRQAPDQLTSSLGVHEAGAGGIKHQANRVHAGLDGCVDIVRPG
jgi:hypothetical protein